MEEKVKGVPDEIKAVARPDNTKIKKSGNNYYVVERTCKYIDGRRVPVETATLGKIVDGKYVAYSEKRIPNKKLSLADCDIKIWGSVKFFDDLSKPILDDLLKIFDSSDANRIYTMALLRAIFGNIVNRDLKFKYETSFISELYKDIPLSEKAICDYLDLLGRNINKIYEFSRNRLSLLDENSKVAIDGMLKDCQCNTSDFCRWSRKCKTKGTKDINIIVAFDINTGEPISYKIYQGNMLDKTAFSDFLATFPSDKYFVLADKGFLDSASTEELINMNSNYIIPLKRNDKIAKECISKINNVLETKDGLVLYGTMEKNGKYYYAFRDIENEENEKKGYIKNARKNNNFDIANYEKKKESFGTIVFETNKKLTALEVYNSYDERWNIEITFNFYKNIVCLDRVTIQDDTSIIGSEFINFISTIISCKAKKKFKELELDKKYSYKQIIQYLNEIKKIKDPINKNWVECKTLAYVHNLGEILKLF